MLRWLSLLAGVVLCIAGSILLRTISFEEMFGYNVNYFREFGSGEPTWFMGYALLVGSGAALMGWGWGAHLARRFESVGWDRAFGPARLGISLFSAAAVLTIVLWGHQQTFLTDDEGVYLFQSKLLMMGMPAAPAPGELSSFVSNVFVVVQDGRWFGQYPPGHPLMLVPALMVGWPYLIPVLLAGLNTWLMISLCSEAFDKRSGLAAGALFAVSPLFLLTGSLLLSHSTSMLGLLVGALGFVRFIRTGEFRAALLCGFGVALLTVTRPFTGLVLGGPLVAAAAWECRKHRWRPLLPLLLPLALGAVGFLAYNQQVTGEPFLTGYQAIKGPGRVELGFGEFAQGYFHTPANGLKNVGILGFRLLFWSWGWALLPLVLFFARPRGRPMVTGSWILLLGGLTGYMLYWSVGVNDSGPVKLYELLVPLALLTVTGLSDLSRRRPGLGPGLAVMFTVVSLIVFVPRCVHHMHRVAGRIQMPLEAVAQQVDTPAVVFVREMQPRPFWSWVFGRPNPDPDFSAPIVYLRDQGSGNQIARKRFLNHKAYRLSFEGRVPVVAPIP